MIPGIHYSHTCPRCRYDLSGLIASWETTCPLAGTCSECGLEFQWTDVLHSHTKRLPAFIEHSPVGFLGARIVFSAWRTVLWTILPWFFWRTVKLHHQIRPPRWPVWLLLTLGGLHIVAAALSTLNFLARFGSVAAVHGRTFYTGVGTVVAPPTTWSWDDVQVLMLGFVARPFAEINAFGQSLTGATEVASVQKWTVTWLVGDWPSFLWVSLAVGAAFPILLALLPDTRKIAKVRSIHLLRGYVFSLSWLVMLSLMHTLRLLALLYDPPTTRPSVNGWMYSSGTLLQHDLVFHEISRYFMVIVAAWLAAWWFCCIKHGLRLNRPLMVWAVLMIPVMLVALITLLYADTFILAEIL